MRNRLLPEAEVLRDIDTAVGSSNSVRSGTVVGRHKLGESVELRTFLYVILRCL